VPHFDPHSPYISTDSQLARSEESRTQDAIDSAASDLRMKGKVSTFMGGNCLPR